MDADTMDGYRYGHRRTLSQAWSDLLHLESRGVARANQIQGMVASQRFRRLERLLLTVIGDALRCGELDVAWDRAGWRIKKKSGKFFWF